MKELNKVYEPRAVERKIYQMWLDGGYFKGVISSDKKPFTIVIPPPNVTGQLHLGHAFDETLQDVLIRVKRMQGYSALWVPGTDHAGIATQIRVEEDLRREGLSRYDLGREKFVERVWQWKNLYGGRIVEQLKTLGCSCDWDRERFTMDEGCSRAVREVFVALYEKGLIYRGTRIINWCPKCTTALSDTEVEHIEQDGHFWHIKYYVKDSEEYLTIATTRPETMLGDTAVAVHPEDTRYSHLVGKTLVLPLLNREIPIIADDYVDREFGTGCVKITPCHDPNDFEVAKRHGLEHIHIFDTGAKVINSGKYDGLDRYDARKAVLEDLQALGLLVKTEPHKHNVGTCYRCSTTVEPYASPQWFVKMEPLAQDALAAVADGRIKFVPDRFVKIYNNWMNNAHDWCISRQLWWGHQIPAWYCGDCGHITVSREDPDSCQSCKSVKITRDEDVLDTWFSSALWPFSTLGWPDKTPDLEYFYPTSVLVTGYDIIFFWVARMIFSGLEHMKLEPFKTVLFHGLIRDAQGRKMSKSLGNGVDPIDVIETYGADALRFNIITGNSPGNDMRFYPERCEAMRNFANKIWNASRFVLMNLTITKNELPDLLETEDKWILSKLNTVAGEVCENIEKYELGVAASKIYDFIWDSYCDWYIELTKPRLNSGDSAVNIRAQQVLLFVLTEILKLLHPFMPFITEEIWGAVPHDGDALIVARYPEYDAGRSYVSEESEFEMITESIRAIRARRAEMNVPHNKRPGLTVVTRHVSVFERGAAFFKKLAYAGDVLVTENTPGDTAGLVTIVTTHAALYIPLSELVDLSAERVRIEKELSKAELVLERLETKLQNPGFTGKAPQPVIDSERVKAQKQRALIENLKESLLTLSTDK